MGGAPSFPIITYHYYDVDIPFDAQSQINNKNNTIWNDKNSYIPSLNNEIGQINNNIANDRRTLANLDKQVSQNTTSRNNLNQNISDISNTINNVDLQTDSELAMNMNNHRITTLNRSVIQDQTTDLNSNVSESINASKNYYSTILEQNNVLSKMLTQNKANLTTNDRKSGQKDDANAFYDTLNTYLFYFYYIFLALLIYLYIFVQIKMNPYIRIAIIVAFAIFPFCAYTIVQGLIYLYRRMSAFALAVPYIPNRQQ